MTQLTQSAQQAAESQAAFDQHAALVKQLGTMQEVAPNWMGAAAAGIRGYVMRKEMKGAKTAGQKAASAKAAMSAAEQQAADARADIEHRRALETEIMKANLRGDTSSQSEWEHERDMYMLEQAAKAGQQLTPLQQQQLGAFKAQKEAENTRASLAGGLDPYRALGSAPRNAAVNQDMTGMQNYDTAARVMELADDDMFGLKATVNNALTGFANWVGGAGGDTLFSMNEALTGLDTDEAKDLKNRTVKMESSLRRLTNRILLERSGAAVTAPEFERFKKEFPVGRMTTKEEFQTKMTQYLDNLTAERNARIEAGEIIARRTGKILPNGVPEVDLYEPGEDGTLRRIPTASAASVNAQTGQGNSRPAPRDYNSMSVEDMERAARGEEVE